MLGITEGNVVFAGRMSVAIVAWSLPVGCPRAMYWQLAHLLTNQPFPSRFGLLRRFL
jgi:hypothetical protein